MASVKKGRGTDDPVETAGANAGEVDGTGLVAGEDAGVGESDGPKAADPVPAKIVLTSQFMIEKIGPPADRRQPQVDPDSEEFADLVSRMVVAGANPKTGNPEERDIDPSLVESIQVCKHGVLVNYAGKRLASKGDGYFRE